MNSAQQFKIILTDDHILLRDALATLINSFDEFKVISVSGNGEELVQSIESGYIPDLILLDLNMPKMDGRECLIELKNDKTLKNIPVIIYSTSDYKLDKEVTKELGADFFLTKLSDIYPLPEELVKAMNKVEGKN